MMKLNELESSSVLRSQRIHVLESENAQLRNDLSQATAENKDLLWQLHKVREELMSLSDSDQERILAALNGERRKTN